jgi:hypothetical protein
MAYVYRHIRLDKNEPFYIGISDNDKYRATVKRCRNLLWKRIVAKTEYEVEILMDNIGMDEAKEKEKEFIKLYGRIDTKTGCLANLTDGGEGTVGRKYSPSKSHRKNLSNSHKGKKMSEQAKEKMSKAKKTAVLQFDLNGNFITEWEGIVDAANHLNGTSTNIMRCCKGKFKQAYGYKWEYKQIEELKLLINK